ncbi:sigma-54 interaction domain-containing protein [Pragia fontium]|uniref:Transcriptional regulator containing PAS, AAA-type ATPase, and DNA-binding Fis domains n=2 Tax=Pragia fontium TaxID=82985 RepID=A0AAJ4WDN2_9GAMM|nr:sigma-54-dependent Fis family transcriptional regulator [Pragia fontium]AKJ40993.1 signal transduction protein [Pragia fontium]SFD46332.1 Transcriptional regulator containing PAS, AAA-type ATPase, and DNA-binding Fis domains [Pragia fontium DSM 5563 = ATCC 49100]SUB81184.1 (S)-limonene 6-monooxygenase [Pragia fontium]VEJ53213.1 (S)-limonene 6-monooxygenase [Pragia fontium]GKX64710.1 ATPase AAA [Pragia fontium]
MISVLSNIQDDICNYADAISGITGTDVEIIDESLMRIAGTGKYRHMLNQNVAKNGYIYRHVLRVQETVLIKNPGENTLCQHCEKHLYCSEMLDLNAPIFLNNRVIGVIGIICSTEEQRQTLLNQIDKFITFIEQVAVMISSKVFECLERLRAQETLGAFRRLIDAMDRGVVAIDGNNLIWHANLSAARLFNREVIGLPLTIETTGDILYGDEEAWLTLEDQKRHVLCKQISLSSLENDSLTMVIFHDARDYMSKITMPSYESDSRARLIGHSQPMEQLRSTIGKIANSYASVLITGESGSGKEVVAFAIHQNSPRKASPFVTINCAAIPEQLLESELFGYVRGAFSGADPKGRVGKFELANGGSLFLDEIGDMPLHLQAKLLRVLQEKAITRVGSNNVINTDVRIIAATNKNIYDMVESGLFREDLYYRLNVVPLVLPSLRERREDIAGLAQYFADEFSESYGRPRQKVPDDMINLLYAYHWPGNIRELRNVIEYIYVMQGDAVGMNASHLPPHLLSAAEKQKNSHHKGLHSLDKQGRKAEKEVIENVLLRFGNSVEGKKQAATELGIGIATLYRKIKRYDLQ